MARLEKIFEEISIKFGGFYLIKMNLSQNCSTFFVFYVFIVKEYKTVLYFQKAVILHD